MTIKGFNTAAGVHRGWTRRRYFIIFKKYKIDSDFTKLQIKLSDLEVRGETFDQYHDGFRAC